MAKYAKVKDFYGKVLRIKTQQEFKRSIEKNDIVLIEKDLYDSPTNTFILFSRLFPQFKFVHFHRTINIKDRIASDVERKIEIYKYGYLIYEFTKYKRNIDLPTASSSIRTKNQADMIRGDLFQDSQPNWMADIPEYNMLKKQQLIAVSEDPIYDAIKTLDDLTYRQVLTIYYFSTIINALKTITAYIGEKFKGIPKELIFLLLTVLIIKYL